MKFYIETDRLILREIRMEDKVGLFELDSDPEVHRYLGQNPVTQTEQVEEVIRFIQQQYNDHGIGRWAVIEKSTGNFIGWSGLKFIAEEYNGHSHFYDLGYRLIRKYWGLGYATETAHAALHHGFSSMNLEEICAMADVDNASSNHVLKKIGMENEGKFLIDGAEHFFYKISRNEWYVRK